jgi:hypothetical protein
MPVHGKGKKKEKSITVRQFSEIFDINKMCDDDTRAKMKTAFEEHGIVCINLKDKVDKRTAVREIAVKIFGQLPYSDEYLLQLKSSKDGRMLHIRNPDDIEDIITELLGTNISRENLKLLKKAYPPHRQFGAPCVDYSWLLNWINNLRQDKGLAMVGRTLLGTEEEETEEEEELHCPIHCPINRAIVRLQDEGENTLLHWDTDPRTHILDDGKTGEKKGEKKGEKTSKKKGEKTGEKQGKREIQGKVCVTKGVFICVPGTHTLEFLGQFCEKYEDLYPGRKLGIAKYGLDPTKDPMNLFGRQVAFEIPEGHVVFWHPLLLHGHKKHPRDEGIGFGCYIGYEKSGAATQHEECKNLYLHGIPPKYYPSGDRVHFFPAKFKNFPHLFNSVVDKLSEEARQKLVTTRTTKKGKIVVEVRPWGWSEDHPFTPFPFTPFGERIVGIKPWEGFCEQDAQPSEVIVIDSDSKADIDADDSSKGDSRVFLLDTDSDDDDIYSNHSAVGGAARGGGGAAGGAARGGGGAAGGSAKHTSGSGEILQATGHVFEGFNIPETKAVLAQEDELVNVHERVDVLPSKKRPLENAGSFARQAPASARPDLLALGVLVKDSAPATPPSRRASK